MVSSLYTGAREKVTKDRVKLLLSFETDFQGEMVYGFIRTKPTKVMDLLLKSK
jgi:hypothetical protein